MKVKIEQLGNSLIIAIPDALIDQLGLHAGDEIDLLMNADKLATVSQREKPKYCLEDLLEGIDENNLHRGWDDDLPIHP